MKKDKKEKPKMENKKERKKEKISQKQEMTFCPSVIRITGECLTTMACLINLQTLKQNKKLVLLTVSEIQ